MAKRPRTRFGGRPRASVLVGVTVLAVGAVGVDRVARAAAADRAGVAVAAWRAA